MNEFGDTCLNNLMAQPVTVTSAKNPLNDSSSMIFLKDDSERQASLFDDLSKKEMDNLAVFCRSFLEAHQKIYDKVGQK